MCGRYSLHTPPEDLFEHFGLSARPVWEPRYNIAPTQNAPVVRGESDGRTLAVARWGLIPFGTEGTPTGPPLINARSETVDTRPAFRWAFRRSRCLVPASGFYEWQKDKGQRQPHYVTFRDARPFAFAGLWDRWAPPERESIESFTILTTDPNDVVVPLHDRMPVILDPAAYGLWLDADANLDDLRRLLVPHDPRAMVSHPVSRRVNKTEDDGSDLIVSVSLPAPPAELDLFSQPPE